MRFEHVCMRFSSIWFSASFFAVQGPVFYGMITTTWRFLRFGAFLIAEHLPWSNVIRSTRMTYGNHGVIMITHRWPKLRYVGTRFRRRYARCTHEYTWWAQDVNTLFPQSNRTQLLQWCAMELLAPTAGDAMVMSERRGKKKLNLLPEKDGVWKDGEDYGSRSGCWERHVWTVW